MGPFRCEVEPLRSAVRVTPVGELGLATVADVEQHIQALLAGALDRLSWVARH